MQIENFYFICQSDVCRKRIFILFVRVTYAGGTFFFIKMCCSGHIIKEFCHINDMREKMYITDLGPLNSRNDTAGADN